MAKSSETLVIGNVDLSGEITGEIGRLVELLGGVTDVASAKAALPALQKGAGGADKLEGLAARLPPR